MTRASSKTFKSGNSAAVRLPKDFGVGIGVELDLVRTGEVIVITRKRPSIDDMLRELDALPSPGEIEVRDSDVVPYRHGIDD